MRLSRNLVELPDLFFVFQRSGQFIVALVWVEHLLTLVCRGI